MKSTITLTALILLMSTMSQAFEGTRGGGDICEERIQSIRNDLQKWISDGGAKALNLPAGVTSETYANSMLAQISKASIRCVGRGDAGYPVTVDRVPKVCRFDRSPMTSQITCDFEKMMALSEPNQYVLVHHEFAGLSGLEQPNGSVSDYKISSQMKSYLEDRVMKRLVVKEPPALVETPVGLQLVPENELWMLKQSFNKSLSASKASCTWSTNHFPEPHKTAVQNPTFMFDVSRAEITRTKDKKYYQFVTYEFPRRVLTLRLNSTGTQILGSSFVIYLKTPDRMENFGTIAEPDYKTIPGQIYIAASARCEIR